MSKALVMVMVSVGLAGLVWKFGTTEQRKMLHEVVMNAALLTFSTILWTLMREAATSLKLPSPDMA